MSRLSYLTAAFLTAGVVAGAALAGQPGETGSPEKTGRKADIVVKRRIELTDEELRKQLQRVPETGLDQDGAAALYAPIKKGGSDVKSLRPDLGPTLFGQITVRLQRPDLFALPWRAGPDCEMGKEVAERLHVLSTTLRDSLRKSVPKDDVRPDPDKLRGLLHGKEWTTPEAIPTLTQMMEPENSPIRLLLVELLGKIKGKEASVALAKRAVFDLSADVRAKAVLALADRPPAEFTPVLYYAMRYPWAAAADHAAETIAALRMTDLVPDLVQLLKEPMPDLPVKTDKGYVFNELVRINHLSNCMVCHAPSLAKADLVRGRVPMPGEDPPPLYYAEATGIFVRADITYLRQDFSVVQPVANAGKWPGNQRFDYVLRARPLTKLELKKFQQMEKEGGLPKTYQQQSAVLFALRQITKKDLGDSYDDWAAGLPKQLKSIKAVDEKK